jgi:hypothetical protein
MCTDHGPRYDTCTYRGGQKNEPRREGHQVTLTKQLTYWNVLALERARSSSPPFIPSRAFGDRDQSVESASRVVGLGLVHKLLVVLARQQREGARIHGKNKLDGSVAAAASRDEVPRQAGKQAGRRAGRQAGRRAGTEEARGVHEGTASTGRPEHDGGAVGGDACSVSRQDSLGTYQPTS